jgi:hypothetical protein
MTVLRTGRRHSADSPACWPNCCGRDGRPVPRRSASATTRPRTLAPGGVVVSKPLGAVGRRVATCTCRSPAFVSDRYGRRACRRRAGLGVARCLQVLPEAAAAIESMSQRGPRVLAVAGRRVRSTVGGTDVAELDGVTGNRCCSEQSRSRWPCSRRSFGPAATRPARPGCTQRARADIRRPRCAGRMARGHRRPSPAHERPTGPTIGVRSRLPERATGGEAVVDSRTTRGASDEQPRQLAFIYTRTMERIVRHRADGGPTERPASQQVC